MNDRLKFRVWGIEGKQYLKEKKYQYKIIDIAVRNNPEQKQEMTLYCDDLGCSRFEHCIQCKDGFVVEQCTGLKDKNGKLVFLGDLLKDEYGRIFTYKELWKDKELICFWQNINFKDYFQEEGYKLGYSDKLEVIGNIHQDSQLLEKGGK